MISRIIAAYRQRKVARAPSSAASALARHGAQLRRQAESSIKATTTAELEADIAAGRISNLGWKQ